MRYEIRLGYGGPQAKAVTEIEAASGVAALRIAQERLAADHETVFVGRSLRVDCGYFLTAHPVKDRNV